MSQKQNFVCPHCNKIFKNPILLPCFDTICEHHLREEMALKQKSIQCKIKTCKQTFNLDGLKSGPNKNLQSLLNDNIHLSDEEKSLKNALLESCANFDQMNREYHDLGSESIKAHFDRLRRQLDERRESLHGKIDEIYFEMIEKTKNCEESVLKNLANNFKAVDVLQLPNRKNLANEIKEKFRETNVELNLLREQLNKSEHEIAHLKIKLDEIAEISKHFASSNYFEFKLLFNHEHFGSLHLNDLMSNIGSHKQVLDFPTIKIENAETMQGIVENNDEEEEVEEVVPCYQNSIKRKRIDDEENLLQSQMLTSKQLSSELIRLCEFSPNDRFTLLYRGTRDGFGSRDFHSKCDNHSNTLTICKTSQKKRRECERSKLKVPEFAYICGGFTTVKWESTYKWKHVSDPNAFVFSLTNKDYKPCKLSVNPDKYQYAVCCHSGSGPRFGDDIFIADDSNLIMSSSKLGETYKRPEHVRAEIEAFSFLAGTEEFCLSEIEVYKMGE
jgi:hypothetical protein